MQKQQRRRRLILASILLCCLSLLLAVKLSRKLMPMVGWRPTPEIVSVAVSAGNLATPMDQLRFRTIFNAQEQQLVGVVRLEGIPNGSMVTGTFSLAGEDPRPLGSRAVTIQAESQIARFAIVSDDPWKPAPYVLTATVTVGEQNTVRTLGESQTIYIGMTREQIEAYESSPR